ncbi:hypothetical protein L6452_35115 [Arctium lappa]|uniref:Uncharacterized protein n=1 Tax=Arctium lappa TaxID=4217 RepID=A0ACB8YLL0_ARCLA|nr:hypothetical protein L6452_35115 [Arctium lappa]
MDLCISMKFLNTDDPDHGYGGSYPSRGRGSHGGADRSLGQDECFKCGRPGHWSRDFPSAGGGRGGSQFSSRSRFGGSGGSASSEMQSVLSSQGPVCPVGLCGGHIVNFSYFIIDVITSGLTYWLKNYVEVWEIEIDMTAEKANMEVTVAMLMKGPAFNYYPNYLHSQAQPNPPSPIASARLNHLVATFNSVNLKTRRSFTRC